MNYSSNEQALEQAINDLPKELEPSRDLWAGIEQAVAKTEQEHAKPTIYSNWKSIAAAFLPIAFLAGFYINGSNPNTDTMPWLEPVTASFELQKQQLLKRVSDHPQITNNWQQSLKELEQAEQSLKQALKSQPGDPALMKMLTHVYQRQLDIIAKSHQPKYIQI
ncbi:hypothetical protein [Psychrosphaera haliotis]|uniref:Uncharacterized protein n=1 Tax=Psychrosphaera haliotis TaxID=555083 RepID=A0A6N8FF04_9GAMM|nr:hypothetical protein [Psychrosphaera haliotis]MUH72831.1 hypothetical protein [Psychrosphaera haliotis]